MADKEHLLVVLTQIASMANDGEARELAREALRGEEGGLMILLRVLSDFLDPDDALLVIKRYADELLRARMVFTSLPPP